MNEKEDFFDKIMKFSGFQIFQPFYKSQKEMLLYLFFGGLTCLVSITTYAFFNITCNMNELIANVLSWMIAVLFAFFTNRIWVFQAYTENGIAFIKQMISFINGRVATLLVEEVILLIFITWLCFPSMIIKIFAQIIVIILNYVISKLFVFKS